MFFELYKKRFLFFFVVFFYTIIMIFVSLLYNIQTVPLIGKLTHLNKEIRLYKQKNHDLQLSISSQTRLDLIEDYAIKNEYKKVTSFRYIKVAP